jgi:mannose-6-phosphate isomerase-like protein (cupin superfamily)
MPCRSVIFSLDSDEEKRRRKVVVAKVNVAEKFGLFDDYWSPKIIGELNDFYVKAVKFKGEFVWHDHETEDEMFFVVKGRLRIKLRDGEVALDPGEFVVIPRKVEHLPIAEDEVHVLLLEPKTTVNTGQAESDRRLTALERI